MRLHILIFILFTIFSACSSSGQELTIVHNHSSEFKIVIPENPKAIEQKAAEVMKRYIERITGVPLEIIKEHSQSITNGIYIGQTSEADKYDMSKYTGNSFMIVATKKDLAIFGIKDGKGALYGVYKFIEKYLDCKKISNIASHTPALNNISIWANILDTYRPPFEYSEVYSPECKDGEFRDWQGLDQFEELWGLWGHSFNKLLPAGTYFKSHPEYYALVRGKRQPTQLCLSNEDVFKLVVKDLKKRIAEYPDATYWSVSPNDDIGYCQCDKCRAIDEAEGGPQGSLITFVNRVAAVFPDKKITTLAYGYTHKPTRTLKPASNVYIFLSDIDAYRDKPIEEEGTAAAFRNDLKGWCALTPNIFVWDYITEFTNYLAPFPDMMNLQANIKYFKNNGVKGVFMQGSGDTYSFMSELKTYMAARLMQDAYINVDTLSASFMSQFYGKAAPFIQQYLELMTAKMKDSHRKLDIYGNPVNEWNSYLTPELIDQYSTLLDKADAAVENDPVISERVMRVRLPLDYTVLQQARFYGIDKHGIFIKDEGGKWQVKPKLDVKVARFVAFCKKAGVTELSEGGLAPDQYQEEWNGIFKDGVEPTTALNANVTLTYPFAEDYPAKGAKTLVDGNPGYKDFSYNWLCFYGTPMEATIDLGKPQEVTTIKMHFLDDPRHWIFLPSTIQIETSEDGVKYTKAGTFTNPVPDEHYEPEIKKYAAGSVMKKARYIRVTAQNLDKLPDWRYRDNKKPMIACDEIYVQ